MVPPFCALSAPLGVPIPPQTGLHLSSAQSLSLTEAPETRTACYLEGWERSRLPAAGLLGVQGRRCPVGVTVASGLRPGDTSPGILAGAEPQQLGECRKGIQGLPGSLQRCEAFLLKPSYVQNLPEIGQPWNQKLVERLVPSLAQLRATTSASSYKGLPRVDNPRQRPPSPESSVPLHCPHLERDWRNRASNPREPAPRSTSHGVGVEPRPGGRTREITYLC